MSNTCPACNAKLGLFSKETGYNNVVYCSKCGTEYNKKIKGMVLNNTDSANSGNEFINLNLIRFTSDFFRIKKPSGLTTIFYYYYGIPNNNFLEKALEAGRWAGCDFSKELPLMHVCESCAFRDPEILLTNENLYTRLYYKLLPPATEVKKFPLKTLAMFEVKKMMAGSLVIHVNGEKIGFFDRESSAFTRDTLNDFFINFIMIKNSSNHPVRNTCFAKQEPAPKKEEDPLVLIEKLKLLKDNGVITEDEYNAKKKELLAKL